MEALFFITPFLAFIRRHAGWGPKGPLLLPPCVPPCKRKEERGVVQRLLCFPSQLLDQEGKQRDLCSSCASLLHKEVQCRGQPKSPVLCFLAAQVRRKHRAFCVRGSRRRIQSPLLATRGKCFSPRDGGMVGGKDWGKAKEREKEPQKLWGSMSLCT